MVFSMTFAVNDPEPEPDPEPTPEPDPEPEPTPTPDPVIIYKTIEKIVTVPEPEADPVTISNGKAVLQAPEAVYWIGYENGRGGASGSLTREDLAVLLLSMLDQESRETLYTETVPFDDVGPGSESAPAIGTVANAEIMVGCGLGAFHPERLLTWGELITVFARFAGDDEPPAEIYTGEHWAKDSINTAISLGWIEYTDAFDPGATVTCGAMVDFIQTVFQWAME